MREKAVNNLNALLKRFGYQLKPSRRARRNVTAFTIQKRLMSKMNRHKLTIFDVGAHLGQSAEQYRRLFPEAEIVCVEPFLDSSVAIQEKFSTDAKVNVVTMAVSDTTGQARFYVNSFAPTNSLLPRPTSARRYYPSKAKPLREIDVDVITIDDLMRRKQILSIDILKIDVQGGELKALEGATMLLKHARVSLIYTELMFVPHYENGTRFYELCAFLAGFGYSLFDFYDFRRATNGQLRQADAIFVSEAVRRSVLDCYPEEP